MIGKRDEFWGGFEKQSALKLRWCRVADCSRGGFRLPETHDRQEWTAVYVGSLAARMTTTGDGDGWKQRRSGWVGKIPWRQAVQETAASVGLAALVWRAHTEKIDVSVWRRHWEPTEVDGAEMQEVLRVLHCSSQESRRGITSNQQHNQRMEHRIGHERLMLRSCRNTSGHRTRHTRRHSDIAVGENSKVMNSRHISSYLLMKHIYSQLEDFILSNVSFNLQQLSITNCCS